MLKGRHVQILIIILLVIALAFTSTAAVAYWNDVNTNSNVIIEFGGEQANLQIVEVGDEFTGRLVPEGKAFFIGQYEEASFTYSVSVDKELVKSVNLIVEASSILIGGSSDYAHLVEITINGTQDLHINELFNSAVEVVVVVKLIEPLDESEVDDPEDAIVEDSVAAFETIKGQDLSFLLSFCVGTKEEVSE